MRTEIVTVDDSGPVLIAVVSDGAGSAKLSAVGSRLLCDHLTDCVIDFLCEGRHLAQMNTHLMRQWIEGYRERMARLAHRFAVQIDDFACTLLCAILGEKHSAFAQIGDGAMIVGPHDEPEQLIWVYWPQQGEYENVTYFATSSDALERLLFDLVPHPVDELAMFTDGIQRFSLHYKSRTVHEHFFLPKFRTLRRESPGFSTELSAALDRYLNSKPVNAATDDDKTLILATRRGIEDPRYPGAFVDDHNRTSQYHR